VQGRIKAGQRRQLPPAPRCKGVPVMKFMFQIKYSFETFSSFRSHTGIQLCIIFLCCVKYQGPQQQVISLQVWLSASFSNRYWKTYKYFSVLFNANIFHFADYVFLIIVSFGMGMTLYSCITPIPQIPRKRYYLRAKASGCWLLFSINQCCHWGQSGTSDCCLLQHQTTSNFFATVSYKLNASINKPNKARVPRWIQNRAKYRHLNGEVVYNLRKMLVSTQRRELL